MTIHEVILNEEVLDQLIRFSDMLYREDDLRVLGRNCSNTLKKL